MSNLGGPGLGGGGGGGGGGGSTLPAKPSSDGTYDLQVTGGVASWQPVGGDAITSFTGITQTIEVGTSLASVTGTATYRGSPTSASVAWSGVASGSQSVPSPYTSTTIAGPFVSDTNAATLNVVLSAVMPDGTHTASQTVTWAAAIVYGSVSGTLTPGQALWDTLQASGSQLHPNLTGSYSFSSGAGANQVFGIVTSLGAPTLVSGGFTYPPVAVGSSNITENGTTQNVTFYTAANPGSTITFAMS
jgi:hypothetical protein